MVKSGLVSFSVAALFTIQFSQSAVAVAGVEAGSEIYNAPAGCHICHGKDATGAYGPNIQGADLAKVNFALSTVDDMKLWESTRPQRISGQDKESLVAYLATTVGLKKELIITPEKAAVTGTFKTVIRAGVVKKAGEKLDNVFEMGKGFSMK